MCDIYYGRVEHPWAPDIENWPEQTTQEIERLQKYKESLEQHVESLGWYSDNLNEPNDPNDLTNTKINSAAKL